MRKINIYGQEATEFVLISVLVFFAAIIVVFIFGGKISNFFQESSSAVKASKSTPLAYKSSGNTKYTDSISASDYLPASNKNASKTYELEGQILTEHNDGSVEFNVEGQTVVIQPASKDLSNIVFETAASNGGLGILAKEIAYMIKAHKNEYPDGKVPVQVSYGQGQRYWDAMPKCGSYCASGNAVANLVKVNVKGHSVIYQFDQETTQVLDNSGTYRIEGNMDNANFNGKVTGKNYKGTKNMNGDFSSANFDANGKFNAHYQDKSLKYGYNWNFDFSDPKMYFDI